MKYPYSQPHLEKQDIEAVVEVLQQRFLTQGPVSEALESAISSLFSVRHAIVCNSGTAALHLLYKSLGLGPNAGLLTTPLTFLATANAARFCEAPVAFADVDPFTGNITLDNIRTVFEAAPFKIKAICIVHLGGRPCENIPEIRQFADEIGVFLVEDACHSPLARYADADGKVHSIGSCEHSFASTLSFHAIKHVTSGEGGVLLTNNDELAGRAKLMRSHGMVRANDLTGNSEHLGKPWYYEMRELGFNYRLSDINSALLLSQLPRLKSNIEYRTKLAAFYSKKLDGVDNIKIPQTYDLPDYGHSWHLFSPLFDFQKIGKSREQCMTELKSLGIGTQVHYIPLHIQPYYASNSFSVELANSEKFYESTLSLPMYYGLTPEDVEYIVESLLSVIR